MWQYYIKTWYGCYLRFRGGRNNAGDLIGDKKTREEVRSWGPLQLMSGDVF
jgi:hypothetical protein